RRRDGEAVEMLGAALRVGEGDDADVIRAVVGQHGVKYGVGAVVIAIERQRRAGATVELDLRLQSAVNARRQATAHDTLAFFALEEVVVHVGPGADGAGDRAVERHALGLIDVVVRLLLFDLFQVADDERSRITDTPFADDADVVNAGRRVGGDGDLEACG